MALQSSAFNSFTFTLAFGCATCILILASLVGDRWTRQELRSKDFGTVLQTQYGNKGVYVRLLVNDTMWAHHFITYKRIEENASFMDGTELLPPTSTEQLYKPTDKEAHTRMQTAPKSSYIPASSTESKARAIKDLGHSATGLSVSALILSTTWIIALCVANSYYSSFPHFRWLPYFWILPAVLNLAAAASWSAAGEDNHLSRESLTSLFGSVWDGAESGGVKTGLSTILAYLAFIGCVLTGHRTALALLIIKERPEPEVAAEPQQGQNLA